jgi:hypothetical protein
MKVFRDYNAATIFFCQYLRLIFEFSLDFGCEVVSRIGDDVMIYDKERGALGRGDSTGAHFRWNTNSLLCSACLFSAIASR